MPSTESRVVVIFTEINFMHPENDILTDKSTMSGFFAATQRFAVPVVFCAVVVCLAGVGNASVVVDDFGTSPSLSLVDQGLVNRTLAGGSTELPSGDVSFSPTGLSLLSYEVADSGTTFGDLGTDFSNGVTFSESSASAGSDFEIAVFIDGIFSGLQSLVNGGLNFNVDLSAASQVAFLTLGCGCPSHTASVGGAFAAVPEPTSLILVGMAGLGFLPRRRSKSDSTL